MLPTQTLLAKFGIEKTLVILISRVYFNTATAAEVHEFIAHHTPDWERCYAFVRQHRIRPFIYYSSHKNNIQLPKEFVVRLRSDVMGLSMANLHQRKHLVELVRGLKTEGIQVIPYKGLSFAKSYYQPPSIRESSDIDLLIHRKSVKAALGYFKDKGMYFKSGWEIPNRWLPYYLNVAKDLELKTPKKNASINCTVEIQWKLTELHMGPFPEFEFFNKGIEKKQQSDTTEDYPRLQPAYDFLAMASNHMIREPLMRFKYVVDTAALLQTAGAKIDGVWVNELLSNYRHKRIVQAGLSAVYDLLGVQSAQLPFEPLPDNELLAVATALPVVKNIEMGNKHYPFFLNFQDSILSKWTARLRTLYYYVLPTESDIRYFNLPVALLPLLFVFRPFRLLFKLFAK